MKIIISIFVWLVFLLIWLLKSNWYFNNEEIFLFWVEEMWKTNIHFLYNFLNNFLIIPEFIDKLYSDNLLKYLNKYFLINYSQIFLGIVFIFYFFITLLLSFSLNYFRENKDKIIVVLMIIFVYMLVVYNI